MQNLTPRLLFALIALGCVAGLIHVLSALPAQISLDPNEGWNAYHALAARSGGALYPPADGLFINNYPPLSFYIVGALGGVLADDILAGRIVSLLSLGVVLGSVVAALRMMRCHWFSAGFAALFLLGGLLLYSDYVGMNDPQMLGHAMEMVALLIALRGGKAAMIAAALFCALAFFVKHNLIALPAALTLWLFWVARKRAVVFAAVYALALSLGLLLVHQAMGVDLIKALASPRAYSLSLLVSNLGAWLAFALVPLVGLTALLWQESRREAALGFCALYAVSSLIAGIYFFGGAGVDMNAMFDADIALALALGFALARHSRRALIAALATAPLAFGLVRSYDPAWLTTSFWLHPYAEEKAGAAADIAFLKARPGPALCETLAFCYWAGKPEAIDVFNLSEAFRLHARSESDLVSLIDAQHFTAVQFEQPAPFGPRVAAALQAHYRLDHESDNGRIFVPR
jgi:hypothetical protein